MDFIKNQWGIQVHTKYTRKTPKKRLKKKKKKKL